MIRSGISGWLYPAWRKTFYPRGLPQHRELGYASRVIRTIETKRLSTRSNRPRSPPSFCRWRDETPDDFVLRARGAGRVGPGGPTRR